MKKKVILSIWALFLGGLLATALPLAAQGQDADVVRVTVTAVGRHGEPPAPVTRDDVRVYQDGTRRPVVAWVPAQGDKAGLDLAILIDDALETSVGAQLDDLRNFIRSLPATTSVAVAYARNGTANVTQNLTTDHVLAAKALRIPLGDVGGGSSPYLSLVDLLKRLPQTNNRLEVLLVSDGIDLFRGFSSSGPGSNMDLDQALTVAQRRGVVVHTLFASGAGRFHRNFFLINNGQGSLSRLALETGGQSFFQGLQTPVAFQPFLEDLNGLLGQQYLLSFRAAPGKKNARARLRVETEVPGVELMAPAHIAVPTSQ